MARKVDAYLARGKEASIDYMRRMYNNMGDVLKGAASIEILAPKSAEVSSFLIANLGQYIEDDWSVVENDSLL